MIPLNETVGFHKIQYWALRGQHWSWRIFYFLLLNIYNLLTFQWLHLQWNKVFSLGIDSCLIICRMTLWLQLHHYYLTTTAIRRDNSWLQLTRTRSRTTKRTSMTREIVHIQAGQCGNQIGAKVIKYILKTSLKRLGMTQQLRGNV